jgi:hypothetical protein
MKSKIYAKQEKNGKGEPFIFVKLSQHYIALTPREADNLQKELLTALWGLYIPEDGGEE